MSIKMTGAEWNRFYADKTVWKEGAYHDDSYITVDGVDVDDDDTINLEKLADDAVVVINCGQYYESEKVRDPVDLLPVIRAWQDSQEFEVVSVQIRKGRKADLVGFLAVFDGKVL
jgi:hypothetical protein